MHLDFAAILVVAAFVTGSIWILDVLVLSPRRALARSGGQDAGYAGKTQRLPWYVDFSRSFFPVILAVLVLRSFVVEPFRIPSDSMMPTLLDGDFILVNKYSFGVRLPVIHTKILDSGAPERGDVAVFRYPRDPSTAFIKRIVGLPGDHVAYRNKQLFINGEPVPQMIQPSVSVERGYQVRQEQLGDSSHLLQVRKDLRGATWEYVVPAGHYFTMGDNRDNSSDSRVWGFLPERNLIGKAFLIWMNWDCVTGRGHCNRIGSFIE